jgi:hypothetical protein
VYLRCVLSKHKSLLDGSEVEIVGSIAWVVGVVPVYTWDEVVFLGLVL